MLSSSQLGWLPPFGLDVLEFFFAAAETGFLAMVCCVKVDKLENFSTCDGHI